MNAELTQALADAIEALERSVSNGSAISSSLDDIRELLAKQRPGGDNTEALTRAVAGLQDAVNEMRMAASVGVQTPLEPASYEIRITNVQYDKFDRLIDARIVRVPKKGA